MATLYKQLGAAAGSGTIGTAGADLHAGASGYFDRCRNRLYRSNINSTIPSDWSMK